MAATELSVQNSTINGIGTSITYSAANADGNFFDNNGKTFLLFKNASGGDITVTVDSQQSCNQGFDHDLSITVNDGDETCIPWLSYNRFNDSNNQAQMTYSSVTDLTVAVISLITST